MIASSALYVILGMIIISIGPKFKRAEMKVGRVILSVILFSIITILAAVAAFLIGFTGTAILHSIGGALIIVAVFLYVRPSISARIVGSIFGFAAISLLLASRATIPAHYTEGLTEAFGSLFFGGTLAYAALLIACTSALLYAFLAGGKHEQMVFLLLGIATTIYGIAIIVGNLDPLVTLPWGTIFDTASTGLAAICVGFIISLIVFTISGFLILATSGISFAVHGGEILPTGPARAPAVRPAPARFCRNCGGPIEKGDKFCSKCGSKISAE